MFGALFTVAADEIPDIFIVEPERAEFFIRFRPDKLGVEKICIVLINIQVVRRLGRDKGIERNKIQHGRKARRKAKYAQKKNDPPAI